MSSATSTLVVIEAPGKADVLRRAFAQAGLPESVTIWATGGHVARYGRSLWPVGIHLDADGSIREPARRCASEQVHILRRMATGRDVVIATDPDDEGDVIARDVAWLCSGVAARIERMHLGALEPAALAAAWAARRPWAASTMLPGDVRRIVDRAVSSRFSRPGVPVGRVLSGYLGAAARQPGTVGHVRLRLPAADGGADYVAFAPVRAGEVDLWRKRLEAWNVRRAQGLRGRRVGTRPALSAVAWGYVAWIVHGVLGRPACARAAVHVRDAQQ